jgi:hypothetical protein
LKYLRVDGRMIIIRYILGVGWEAMDWIDVAQDRDRCWALVNAVINLHFPQNSGNDLTSLGLVRCSGKALLHQLVSLMPYFFSLKKGFLL